MSNAKLKRDIEDMEQDLEGTLVVLFMTSSNNPNCLPMYHKVKSIADWDNYSKLADLRQRRHWLQTTLGRIQTELMAAMLSGKRT